MSQKPVVRRGRGGRFPAWYNGRQRNDDISDFWYGELEGKLFQQRGLLVDKKNFDTLTDQQRAEDVKARLNRPSKRNTHLFK